MRRINPRNFRVARKGTSREINRQIILTLVRAHQSISRADLARMMDTNRANVTLLVNEMLRDGLILEGAAGEAARGRKPTLLCINSRGRCVIAVDIRKLRTYVMLTDSLGKRLAGISSFPTERMPGKLIVDIRKRVRQMLADNTDAGVCQGIGVSVPGMVDANSGIVLNAPPLGWRDLNLRDRLSTALGLPVYIENSGRACALAQMWSTHGDLHPHNDLVFVSISDGVGIGVIINGELLRGRNNIAGQFAHVPINENGPLCTCGARGCWEVYVSNLATVSRYFGRTPEQGAGSPQGLSIEDLIARARGGDDKALAALRCTARYVGVGLSTIVKAFDPSCVYVGGEITAAWDILEGIVRATLRERSLLAKTAALPIRLAPVTEYPRLHGAAMLVTAPAFAAPSVA
jgi:N-acetylglucosamine repressor